MSILRKRSYKADLIMSLLIYFVFWLIYFVFGVGYFVFRNAIPIPNYYSFGTMILWAIYSIGVFIIYRKYRILQAKLLNLNFISDGCNSLSDIKMDCLTFRNTFRNNKIIFYAETKPENKIMAVPYKYIDPNNFSFISPIDGFNYHGKVEMDASNHERIVLSNDVKSWQYKNCNLSNS